MVDATVPDLTCTWQRRSVKSLDTPVASPGCVVRHKGRTARDARPHGGQDEVRLRVVSLRGA